MDFKSNVTRAGQMGESRVRLPRYRYWADLVETRGR
jgi:hypothetical protein